MQYRTMDGAGVLVMYSFNIKRIKQKKTFALITVVLLVCYCFYSYGLQPYFVWETFAGGVFSEIFGFPVRSIISLLFIIFGLVSTDGKTRKIEIWFALWILFDGLLAIFAGGTEHMVSFEFLLYVAPAVYVVLSDSVQIKTYNVFYTVFVFFLIVPFFIYILVHMGVNVPYSVLESPEKVKTYYGVYYKVYPLAVQWTHNYNFLIYKLRFCGIFNECGVVGTFSAFFLCANDFKLKGNWKNKFLLLCGIISFSLAFYVIVVLFLAIKSLSINPKKIIIIVLIIVSYFTFINIDFSDPILKKFQGRFRITTGGLSGDNRTDELYDKVFIEGITESPERFLFGHGSSGIEEIIEKRKIDACSYKNLIYNYGIVGFVGQILWILLYTYFIIYKHSKDKKRYILAFVSVFLISMYQRQYFYSLCYYVILIGGLKNNCYLVEDNKSLRSEKGGIDNCK